jgi:hypothetical protein
MMPMNAVRCPRKMERRRHHPRRRATKSGNDVIADVAGGPIGLPAR